ncbi:MAG: hypothetical protein IIY69_01485 [Clostridia bacterium]|nr:hypothetical protein [Clostridia bacterium]
MENKKPNALTAWWRPKWQSFEEKSPEAAKLIGKIAYFLVFSLGITVIQFLILLFLPSALGLELASREAMWPSGIEFDLLGSHVKWCLVGAEVLRDSAGNVIIGGGLGAAIANWVAPFIAQCINFPLQRNITFKSHGNVVFQLIWYFIAWVAISLITGGLTNLFKPVIIDRFGTGVFSLIQTVVIGGVSMVVMFFVFMIIFPEGEAKKKEA